MKTKLERQTFIPPSPPHHHPQLSLLLNQPQVPHLHHPYHPPRQAHQCHPLLLPFTPLEGHVLDWIATRTTPELAEQLRLVNPWHRRHTGSGSYTYLALPKNVPQAAPPKQPVDGPQLIESPFLDGGAGSVLWLKDGIATCLEIYAYGKDFPAWITDYAFAH